MRRYALLLVLCVAGCKGSSTGGTDGGGGAAAASYSGGNHGGRQLPGRDRRACASAATARSRPTRWAAPLCFRLGGDADAGRARSDGRLGRDASRSARDRGHLQGHAHRLGRPTAHATSSRSAPRRRPSRSSIALSKLTRVATLRRRRRRLRRRRRARIWLPGHRRRRVGQRRRRRAATARLRRHARRRRHAHALSRRRRRRSSSRT